MGALLRLILRLALAPLVFVLLGLCGTIGFVLAYRRAEEFRPEPDERQERRAADEIGENERGERRWAVDLKHTDYAGMINRAYSRQALETAARIPPGKRG